ncbi:MAG: hypothetical protein IPF56_13415 [Chloroflexi bacterium]|nr:hypothetical protein [Chloroflexota bacterium]
MKRKIALGVVGLLVAAYIVLAWRVAPAPAHPYFTGVERPLVMAHQGGERLYPSNTLRAMQESVALGVDVLEMDIHASSDGVLVVIHDDTVDRTTDGTGAVKEITFAELSQLDAGYYWTDDEEPPIPTGAGHHHLNLCRSSDHLPRYAAERGDQTARPGRRPGSLRPATPAWGVGAGVGRHGA